MKEAVKEEIVGDFISKEKKKFRWSLGKLQASALSGFIAGIIVTTIFFLTIFDVVLKF